MKKCSISFFAFLLIAIIALIADYIIFIFKASYPIALAVSGVLTIGISILVIKKKNIQFQFKWNCFDCFFFVTILILLLLNISIPDFSYDVSNYHIYLQQNILIDKVNFDFFAGKTINGFLFPLGDRMHYICRLLLGYRAGTILSFFSLIVIFYQAKRILKLKYDNDNLISCGAFLCSISSFVIRQWLSTYYIDLLGIPFILEIIYICFRCLDEKRNINYIYIGLLSGIATGIKITNLILIVPIIIYFMVRYKKLEINWKLPLAFLVFLLPFAPYAIDNYVQTGSPLFPYYNNILHSPYFGNYSWVDSRFGIPNFLYAIIWPIYVSISESGYGDDCFFKDYIWAIGYVFAIICVFYIIFKKKTNDLLSHITTLALILTTTWILFLEGYMRYALIIPILYSILMCIVFFEIYNRYFKKVAIKLLPHLKNAIYVMSVFLIFVSIINMNDKAKNNYSLLFKDRKISEIKIDGIWGTLNDDVALTELVRSRKTPIVNLDISLFESSQIALDKYNEIIKQNDIYLIAHLNRFDQKIQAISDNGFEIENVVAEYTSDDIPCLSTDDKAYLLKLKYVGNESKN